jgi:serine/threonine-protein kinase
MGLGYAMRRKGRPDEAIAAYRESVRLKPDYAEAHNGLGNALYDKGKPDEAVAEYREATRLEPDHAEAHCNLGHALRQKGEFRTALADLRRGHELGSKNPDWRYPSAQWVRECERLVELNDRLPGFLTGSTAPAGPGERIELARICALKHLPRAAVRFFTDAFAAQPELAEDLSGGNRYNAACAAALAGCGHGQDAAGLDQPEPARLRGQALKWLRADLAAWRGVLEKEPDKSRPLVRQQMEHWQQDGDFAGVRGPLALAKLPESERQDWQKLWADVQELFAKAGAKNSRQEK